MLNPKGKETKLVASNNQNYFQQTNTRLKIMGESTESLLEEFIKDYAYEDLLNKSFTTNNMIVIKDGSSDIKYEIQYFSKNNPDYEFIIEFFNWKTKQVLSTLVFKAGNLEKNVQGKLKQEVKNTATKNEIKDNELSLKEEVPVENALDENVVKPEKKKTPRKKVDKKQEEDKKTEIVSEIIEPEKKKPKNKIKYNKEEPVKELDKKEEV